MVQSDDMTRRDFVAAAAGAAALATGCRTAPPAAPAIDSATLWNLSAVEAVGAMSRGDENLSIYP